MFTLLVDPAIFDQPAKREGRGKQPIYAEALIIALVSLRIMLQLPYRVLEGAARAIYQARKLPVERVPDHTTLCRRQANLKVSLSSFKPRPGEPVCLLVDSTGVKVAGQGEWNVRQHGVQGRRTWIKVHLMTDAETGEIVALDVTPPTEGDSPVMEKLVSGLDLKGVTTIGDGAYDSKRCYQAVHAAGGQHLAPPKTGAVRWNSKVPAFKQRNRHLDNMHLVGRKAWKAWAGYHRRSAVESAMHRFKWITGERALSRSLANLKVEITLRAQFLNRILTSAIC